MKKLLCIVLAVIMVMAFAGSALAAGGDYDVSPTLPSGESLRFKSAYDSTSPQWQMFQEYIDRIGLATEISAVIEIGVWDEHLSEWIMDREYAGIDYTISFEGDNMYLHSNALTGGVEYCGAGGSATTSNGFGLFAICTNGTPAPAVDTSKKIGGNVSGFTAGGTYAVGQKLTFGAGERPDFETAKWGDEWNKPVSWYVTGDSGVIASGNFGEKGPQSATFSASAAGRYFLVVTYDRYIHNGVAYVITENQQTQRSVEFFVK